MKVTFLMDLEAGFVPKKNLDLLDPGAGRKTTVLSASLRVAPMKERPPLPDEDDRVGPTAECQAEASPLELPATAPAPRSSAALAL